MSIWLLISLLQLNIPFTMLLRSQCIKSVSYNKIHWISSFVVIVGCIVHVFRLIDSQNRVSIILFLLFALKDRSCTFIFLSDYKCTNWCDFSHNEGVNCKELALEPRKIQFHSEFNLTVYEYHIASIHKVNFINL